MMKNLWPDSKDPTEKKRIKIQDTNILKRKDWDEKQANDSDLKKRLFIFPKKLRGRKAGRMPFSGRGGRRY